MFGDYLNNFFNVAVRIEMLDPFVWHLGGKFGDH